MKKIVLLLLIQSLLFVGIPLFGMEKDAEQWLILGAGTEDDVAEWNDYASKRRIQWKGVNNAPSWEPIENAFRFDFNDVEALDEQLPNNFYDSIIFDKETIDFAQWNKDHLNVILKKLKSTGKLLVPFSPSKLIIHRDAPVVIYGLYERRFNNLLKLKTSPLITGFNYLREKFPKYLTETQHKEFFLKYQDEVIIPHNRRVLEALFDVEFKEDRQYPHRSEKHKKQRYYVLKPKKDS